MFKIIGAADATANLLCEFNMAEKKECGSCGCECHCDGDFHNHHWDGDPCTCDHCNCSTTKAEDLTYEGK